MPFTVANLTMILLGSGLFLFMWPFAEKLLEVLVPTTRNDD
jgi:hypothetical protein